MEKSHLRFPSFYSFLSDVKENDINNNLEKVRDYISSFFKGGLYEADKSVNIYVMHFATGQFLYISNTANSFGFNVDKVYLHGLEYFNRLSHPDDLDIRNKKIEPLFIQLLSAIEPQDLKNWHFSWDFRVIFPDNSVKKFLQNFTVVVDENKLPFLIFSKVRDLTDYYINNRITFTSTHDTANGPIKQSYVFFPDNKSALSIREKEILKLIKSGFSSKEIAQELYISVNTVNNHRKNMLQKTGLKNTAELITYIIDTGEL